MTSSPFRLMKFMASICLLAVVGGVLYAAELAPTARLLPLWRTRLSRCSPP